MIDESPTVPEVIENLRKIVMRNLGVGIIGLGSIGGFVAQQVINGKVPGASLIAVANVERPPLDLSKKLDKIQHLHIL